MLGFPSHTDLFRVSKLLGFIVSDTTTKPSSSSSIGVLGGEEEIAAVCVDGCRADLLSVKATIAAACTSSEDIMVYQQIAYPGMW